MNCFRMFVAYLFVGVMLLGCSGGPPDDAVKKVASERVDEYVLRKLDSPIGSATIESFDIKNKYKEKDGQGRDLYVYEYAATFRYDDDARKTYKTRFDVDLRDTDQLTGTIRLVKKGDEWYHD